MSPDKPQSWRTYEDAVRAIVAQHSEFFGLEGVEPSAGKAEGTSGNIWNIEVIGYSSHDGRLVLFEVRRKTSRNITPAEAGELAYRIEDTGAEKGYFVTPLGRQLSRGAKKIAGFEEIGHIQVQVDSTPEIYLMQYVGKIFIKLADKITWQDAPSVALGDKDGNVIRKKEENG